MNENTKILIEFLESNNFQYKIDNNPSQAKIDLIMKKIEQNKIIRGE